VDGMLDVIRNPIYSTAVGLLLYGKKKQEDNGGPKGGGNPNGRWAKVKNWIKGNF
jgi:cell division protein FtsA